MSQKHEGHKLLRKRGLGILRDILPKKKIQQITHQEYPQGRNRGLTSVLYVGLLIYAQIQRSINNIDELLASGLGKIREIYRIKSPLISKQAFSLRSKKLPYQIGKRIYEYLLEVAAGLNLSEEKLFQGKYLIKLLDSSLIDVVARLIGVTASKPSRRLKGNKSLKGQIKLKGVFNWCARLPEMIQLSRGLSNELSGVKKLVKKALKRAKVVILVFDLGFFAYEFLHWLVEQKVYFVSRIKANTRYEIIKQLGWNEWLVRLGITSKEQKPVVLRLVRIKEKKRWYYYITNLMDVKRFKKKEIRLLYRYRWQIEIFFKELKHILNITKIFSYNPNGIKGQIYLALAVYVMMKILIAQSAAKHKTKASELSFSRSVTAVRIWLMHHPEKIFCEKPRGSLIDELLDQVFIWAHIKKKNLAKPAVKLEPEVVNDVKFPA